MFSEGLSFWFDGEHNVISNWTQVAAFIPGSKTWSNNGSPAPFDQEFYLTIGVGVGGRNDFLKTDTPWERTSPQQRQEFYNAKHKWYPSWTDNTKALEIRSVKITSL